MKKLLILFLLVLPLLFLSLPVLAADTPVTENTMAVDLTPFVQAFLALLVALITHKLVPWIKSKTTAQQRDNLLALVKTLVYAAEQLGKAGQITDKFAYVENRLYSAGYKLSTAEVTDMIEAAVTELKLKEPIVLGMAELETAP